MAEKMTSGTATEDPSVAVSPAWRGGLTIPPLPSKSERTPWGLICASGWTKEFSSKEETANFLCKPTEPLPTEPIFFWQPNVEEAVLVASSSEFLEVTKANRKIRLEESLAHEKGGLAWLIVPWALFFWLSGFSFSFLKGMGGVVLGLFTFGALYRTWQVYQELKRVPDLSPEEVAKGVEHDAFEGWLFGQKPRFTVALVAILSVVFLVQESTDGALSKAGFYKNAYHAGESWRLLTGAYLHGNLVHLLMNLSALWYLGRRVEALTRFVHLPLIYLLSLYGSGLATLYFLPNQPSVGASGAILGLLGFLLVFELLHQKLVPKPARKELAGMLALTLIIGLIGFRFIDNAAHIGGVVTGAIYAALVFPKSSSPHRPVVLTQDRILAGLALAFLIYGALYTILRIVG